MTADVLSQMIAGIRTDLDVIDANLSIARRRRLPHAPAVPPEAPLTIRGGQMTTAPKTQPASLYADPEMQKGVATIEVPAPFYPSLIEYEGDIYQHVPGYGFTGGYTKVTDIYTVKAGS